jgi:hypothetical protein
MPSQVAGNLVLDSYTVLDGMDVPLTGMTSPADVALTLYRQSGVTMIAAAETVAWAEIGASGTYYFSFTPTATGLYMLRLVELNVNTALRQSAFRYDVLASGAQFAPSYANAFCAESDVERYLLQPIDTTTKPNDTTVAGWAQGRADALESLCAGLGLAITPSTVTAGSRLEGLLREANAIGAAMDATVAQVFGTAGAKTDKAEALQAKWVEYYGGPLPGFVTKVVGLIEAEIKANSVSLSTNHTLSGDTLPRDNSNPPRDVGAQVTMTDVH